MDFGKQGGPQDEKTPTRILGGIAAPTDEESWFFKLMGPNDAVSKQEKAFDVFLDSIQFVDSKEKPITWTLPEGWRDGPKKPGRYATILTGPQSDAVELSVISAGGSLIGNVNRWREQVGLEALPPEKLSESSREITTKQGKKMTRVDVSGLAGKGAGMPPFMKGMR